MTRRIAVVADEPPFVLRAIRAVLVIWGILAVIGTVSRAMSGVLFIDIAVLNLFAGTWLLRGSRSWRLVVLAELWYLFIGCGIGLFLIFEGTGLVVVDSFGSEVGTISRGWAVSVVLCVVIVGVWMYVALCLPKVRAYFNVRSWPLIDPALIRQVERLEGHQGRAERDVMLAQIRRLERAISALRQLREDLAELHPEQIISEARQVVDDYLGRALRIQRAHLSGESDSPADLE